jgi:hypothetical protein
MAALNKQIFIDCLRDNIEQHYSFDRKLGDGGSGSVHLCRDRNTQVQRGELISKSNVVALDLLLRS